MKRKIKIVALILILNLVIEFYICSVNANNINVNYFLEKNELMSRKLAGATSTTGLYYPDAYANREKYDVIDVSAFQGNIDWGKVYNSGVKAAIIRVGGRYYGSGGIYGDDKFSTNLKGAKDAGLKVGVYFFSAAINESEAEQEAKYAINQVKNTGVSLDLPIYIDFEGDGNGGNNGGRVEKNINQSTGTKILKKFCDTVKANGYLPGIYAGYFFLGSYSNRDTVVGWNYNMWLAWYTNNALYNVPYTVDVWQYTGSGKVNGISGDVDKNIFFIDKVGKAENLKYSINTKDASKATLSWNYIDGVDDYVVEITQGGKTTKKEVSAGSLILNNTITATVSLVEGTNKFRVRAVNKKCGFEEYGDYSNTVTIEYEEAKGLKGDIDGNGSINLTDVLKLRRYIANSAKWNLTNEEKNRADINGDGKIDLSDVLKLRRYISASSNASTKSKHPDWIW